jgi:glycosyltransferase involved in cell wall biosynthesis
VLHEILQCYPNADVFTLFDVLTPKDRAIIGIERTKTSFLQKMPFIQKRHRHYLPLMPLAVEQFDFSSYDLIISSSYAVAKGILTGPDQVHVSYVHSPMRYAWDLQHAYLRESGYDRGLKGALARIMLHRMRIWDARTAHGPDTMIANSHFVARRIKKVYGRDADVVHPPVTLSKLTEEVPRGTHFLAASRLVPYKNIESIIQAFRTLPDLQLIVAGSGPEAERLKQAAPPNVSFAGFVSDEKLRHLMASARAFVFAAEEDFGIIVVEAMSEGAPVLALGRGGALETVSAAPGNRTGMFFPTPDPQDIAQCIRAFVEQEDTFSRDTCRDHAKQFSAERFRREFKATVDASLASHPRNQAASRIEFATQRDAIDTREVA